MTLSLHYFFYFTVGREGIQGQNNDKVWTAFGEILRAKSPEVAEKALSLISDEMILDFFSDKKSWYKQRVRHILFKYRQKYQFIIWDSELTQRIKTLIFQRLTNLLNADNRPAIKNMIDPNNNSWTLNSELNWKINAELNKILDNYKWDVNALRETLHRVLSDYFFYRTDGNKIIFDNTIEQLGGCEKIYKIDLFQIKSYITEYEVQAICNFTPPGYGKKVIRFPAKTWNKLN